MFMYECMFIFIFTCVSMTANQNKDAPRRKHCTSPCALATCHHIHDQNISQITRDKQIEIAMQLSVGSLASSPTHPSTTTSRKFIPDCCSNERGNAHRFIAAHNRSSCSDFCQARRASHVFTPITTPTATISSRVCIGIKMKSMRVHRLVDAKI